MGVEREVNRGRRKKLGSAERSGVGMRGVGRKLLKSKRNISVYMFSYLTDETWSLTWYQKTQPQAGYNDTPVINGTGEVEAGGWRI